MRDLYKILNNTPHSVTQILFSVKSQIQVFVYKINIFLTKGQPIKCIVPTTFIFILQEYRIDLHKMHTHKPFKGTPQKQHE